jgi:hypothetical protein
VELSQLLALDPWVGCDRGGSAFPASFPASDFFQVDSVWASLCELQARGAWFSDVAALVACLHSNHFLNLSRLTLATCAGDLLSSPRAVSDPQTMSGSGASPPSPPALTSPPALSDLQVDALVAAAGGRVRHAVLFTRELAVLGVARRTSGSERSEPFDAAVQLAVTKEVPAAPTAFPPSLTLAALCERVAAMRRTALVLR